MPPPPPPEIVDGEEPYEVERILDSRFTQDWLHFLVKWKGYGYEENSWIPEEDLAAPARLWEFYATHPGAPQQVHLVAFQSLALHASRTQHPRRGGDVRRQPISEVPEVPKQLQASKVHSSQPCSLKFLSY